MRRRLVVATGVALLLADVAIVTLALPQLLVSFHTSILGVAAVLFVYLAVFAGAVLVAVRVRRVGRSALVSVVQAGFAPAFVATGILGLLAAVCVLVAERPRASRRTIAGVVVVVVSVPGLLAAGRIAFAPSPVRLGNPCAGGPLAHSGGISGFLQDRALELVDEIACRLHTSREELVLATASPDEARRFASEHGGLDPHRILRSVEDVFGSL